MSRRVDRVRTGKTPGRREHACLHAARKREGGGLAKSSSRFVLAYHGGRKPKGAIGGAWR